MNDAERIKQLTKALEVAIESHHKMHLLSTGVVEEESRAAMAAVSRVSIGTIAELRKIVPEMIDLNRKPEART